MEIITGKTESAHIYSSDEGALYASIIGPGQYVLPLGEKLMANMTSANKVRLLSGELVMNGRLGRIRPGEYDELDVQNGASGYNRIDLLVIRYANTNGIESMTPMVITGESVTGEPSAPTYNTGNIYNGDTPVDFPLYKMQLTGVSAPTLTAMFETVDVSLASIKASLANLELAQEVQDLYDPVVGS